MKIIIFIKAAFYHFKRSDFDIFTIRCSQCNFGYYSHLHFQHSHRDCIHQTESKYREKVSEEEFEAAKTSFSLKLKPINGTQLAVKSLLQAKHQLTDFQQKLSTLADTGGDNEKMVMCVDKSCSFTGQLKHLIPHLADKHPYINNEFRSRKSEFFEHKCDKCEFYYQSKSARFAHCTRDECAKNKDSLMQYRTFMDKFGASSKEQIQLQMRSSIRIATTTTTDSNKRKSIEPAGDEVAKRVKVEEPQVKEEPEELNMDESFESIDKPVVDKPAGVVSSSNESSKKKANTEFSCDYCSGDVSFPIFNLLVVHIKNEHASEYFVFGT